MTNKLQDMLGDLEDKVRQAGAQGTSREVLEQLSQLSQRYSTAGELIAGFCFKPSKLCVFVLG